MISLRQLIELFALMLILASFPGDSVEEDPSREFREIIEKASLEFRPIAQHHGAHLVIDLDWDNPWPGARSERDSWNGNEWKLVLGGGMAKRAGMTPDGFLLLVCHELGHFLGGYPYFTSKTLEDGHPDLASSEGQADYFATQACLKRIWEKEPEQNRAFRSRINSEGKTLCDQAWKDERKQDLCYRIVSASISVSQVANALEMEPGAEPSLKTPDRALANHTVTDHVSAQCRLDTFLAGALCERDFDLNTIPGLSEQMKPRRTVPEIEASEKIQEAEAVRTSCETKPGSRPSCWFKSAL